MSDLIDPQHNQVRSLFRLAGPAIAAVGLLLTVVGIASFFSSFGGFGPPRYFWCAFVGMPLLFVGFGISQFGFMGAITRYIASEGAPVGKDLTNYMVEGTRHSIRGVAAAIGEGFSAAKDSATGSCVKCGAENDGDAHFCNQCGAPVSQTYQCPKCNENVKPDARFCHSCGSAIA